MKWPKELKTSPVKLVNQSGVDYLRRTGRAGIPTNGPYIIEPLHAEYRAGRRYELVKPFVFLSAIVGPITVEAGFITDFHSIPRLVWSFLPPDDWAEAAVAHDKLCKAHRSDTIAVTSHQAAEVHRECALHVGATPWREEIMYRSIDWFGPHW